MRHICIIICLLLINYLTVFAQDISATITPTHEFIQLKFDVNEKSAILDLYFLDGVVSGKAIINNSNFEVEGVISYVNGSEYYEIDLNLFDFKSTQQNKIARFELSGKIKYLKEFTGTLEDKLHNSSVVIKEILPSMKKINRSNHILNMRIDSINYSYYLTDRFDFSPKTEFLAIKKTDNVYYFLILIYYYSKGRIDDYSYCGAGLEEFIGLFSLDINNNCQTQQIIYAGSCSRSFEYSFLFDGNYLANFPQNAFERYKIIELGTKDIFYKLNIDSLYYLPKFIRQNKNNR